MLISFLERAAAWRSQQALIDDHGSLDFGQLLTASEHLAATLGRDLAGQPVALYLPPSNAWVVALLAVWRAGGVAVPLALSHPDAELDYVLDDAGCQLALASPDLADRLGLIAEARGIEVQTVADPLSLAGKGSMPVELDAVTADQAALLIYTSGTTGRPKGVILSHGNLAAQVESLLEAWAWSADDHILETLPLHHVHGIVNVLLCALAAGASARILPRFDAERVWREIEAGELTLLMAVPTIYVRLIDFWRRQPTERQEQLSRAASQLRLMVSGSAALPETVLEAWREITGHVLLERYGMSEIGMALSNPLDGERLAGTVGRPLPGVELRVVGSDGQPVAEGEAGTIEVRGPAVFSGYWRRPEATAEAFRDGWFVTGDVALVEGGVYRLLGRQSVDILKSGGEKISALEIEAVLRQHPAIEDCAVVGIADDEWGQRVACAYQPTTQTEAGKAEPIELEVLRDWARSRLAVYKLPTLLRRVDQLPRNALGKVQKPAVAKLFDS